MSAIAGIISQRPTEELAERVAAMCDIQKLRGPRGTGINSLPGACLGRDLFILENNQSDDHGGALILDAERVAVVFDGVLFNRDEIHAALAGGKGKAPREPDGMLILKSYLAWGNECVKRLDGLFSFAIWNWKENVLYAARDRLGEKPFYYHAGPRGEFILASEIKALLKSGLVTKELDHEAIYQYFHEKGFRSPCTPLAAVRSLEPGHWLEYRDGVVATREFWDIPFISEKVDDEAYVFSRMREILCTAVAERLRGDGEPALLYSGGIDSSLLLGVLARVTDRRIKTFTIATGTTEVPLALSRKISSQFNTAHTEITISAKDIAADITDLVWHLSAPTVHSILPYFCCHEAQKRGVSTIFSGHQADSTLQGEWFTSLVMTAERVLSPFRFIPEGARARIYDFSERSLREKARKRRTRLERYLGLIYEYFRYKRGLSHWYGSRSYPDQIAKLFSPDIDRRHWLSPADLYRSLYKKCGSRQMDERTGYCIIKAGSGPSALINYESIGAAFAMQMQTPFQDQQLVEFSRSIPFRIRGKNNIEKYILRTLCREFVSPECAAQEKAGFILPFDGWLRADLWPIVEDTLSRASVERRAFLDYARVAAMNAAYRSGRSSLSWVDIWAPVVLEIWLRTHCDPSPERLAHPL